MQKTDYAIYIHTMCLNVKEDKNKAGVIEHIKMESFEVFDFKYRFISWITLHLKF